MLSQEASSWNLNLSFLESSPDSPAALISSGYEKGNFKDYDDVLKFSEGKDILTIEIENVNVEALKKAEENGCKVIPSAHIIETIKDKGLQKLFYREKGLPSSEFKLFSNKAEIMQALDQGDIALPFGD